MEDPKEKIIFLIKNAAKDLLSPVPSFKIEQPNDKSHGDFATNVALVLAQTLKRKPLDIAHEIAEKIILEKDFISDIQVASPGFINFWLSEKYLQSQIQDIIEQGDGYGSLSIGKGKKASVEFVSANPTGPLHIGNARGGPLGDSLANVFAKAGYEVIREYLHNDVGGQVERLGEAIYFTLHPDQKAAEYEMQYQGEYIKELAEQVKQQLEDDQEDFSQEQFIEKAGAVAVKLMLTEILKDCEDMGIKFNLIRKESDLRKEVPAALSKIKQFIEEKDGAEWFAPNDEFLKDRETVVKKSDGQFTYFASDIAYHNEKFVRVDGGIVVDVLGANHSGHVPRLKAVVKALGFDPDNLQVTLYQWVRLKRGDEIVKMSKRAGNFVTSREVLDEVGKDAFRFFLLTPKSSTHMDFDLELAKKRASDNPVFYVQYAHSRICSIFKKAPAITTADLSLLKTPEEILLIRHLLKLPYLVEDAVKTLEVNPLTTYATEIAMLFHKFYETNQVITQDAKLTQARLALLKATQITLANTLSLLGVSAPEHM